MLLLAANVFALTIVTGPVKKSDGGNYAGRLLLKPLTLPGVFGGATVIGNDLTAKAAADGTLQNLDGTPLSLEPGTWEVDFTSVTGAKPVYLNVPTYDGTASFTELLLLEQPDGSMANAVLSDARLKEIVSAEGFEFTAISYDADGVVTTATVFWPDGSAGVLTTTLKNATFLKVDAYTITHANSGRTVTQAPCTRDSFGRVIVKPALTVT